ncbi:hypothetical protein BKA65DRAFT_266421 [Rhexocercosporidium sp. MPI-PUGE-AT-0058]|nr:hypothetical protein BKA65DRAFT_266421 [Rhexocercosporidium sp. MPI-PUGE-AT-0058]
MLLLNCCWSCELFVLLMFCSSTAIELFQSLMMLIRLHAETQLPQSWSFAGIQFQFHRQVPPRIKVEERPANPSRVSCPATSARTVPTSSLRRGALHFLFLPFLTRPFRSLPTCCIPERST